MVGKAMNIDCLFSKRTDCINRRYRTLYTVKRETSHGANFRGFRGWPYYRESKNREMVDVTDGRGCLLAGQPWHVRCVNVSVLLTDYRITSLTCMGQN